MFINKYIVASSLIK